MWYSFDGGLHNYTIEDDSLFEQSTWASLTAGEITITFYARDLAGNLFLKLFSINSLQNEAFFILSL